MTQRELKGLDQLDQLQRREYGTICPLCLTGIFPLVQSSFVWCCPVGKWSDCSYGACTNKLSSCCACLHDVHQTASLLLTALDLSQLRQGTTYVLFGQPST